MAADDGLVLLRGQWVGSTARSCETGPTGSRSSSRRDGLSFIEGMRLLAGVPADLEGDDAGADQRGGRSSMPASGSATCSRVEVNLRRRRGRFTSGDLASYQTAGVNWLRFLSGLGLGSCLADDMGLGKTIQVLAPFVGVEGKERSFAARIAGLVGSNWKAEMARFAPRSAVFTIRRKRRKTLRSRPIRKRQPGRRLVVTTYSMLLRQDWLFGFRWRLVVLDEAQAIKNPGARQTKLVKRLQAEARIALTGTPVENRLSDLWSLFDFLCPGLLGSQAKFKQFAKRLNDRAENRYAPLRSLVQPYILRRLKTDRRIIDDLPEKIEVRAYAGLSKRLGVMYARLVEE